MRNLCWVFQAFLAVMFAASAFAQSPPPTPESIEGTLVANFTITSGGSPVDFVGSQTVNVTFKFARNQTTGGLSFVSGTYTLSGSLARPAVCSFVPPEDAFSVPVAISESGSVTLPEAGTTNPTVSLGASSSALSGFVRIPYTLQYTNCGGGGLSTLWEDAGFGFTATIPTGGGSLSFTGITFGNEDGKDFFSYTGSVRTLQLSGTASVISQPFTCKLSPLDQSFFADPLVSLFESFAPETLPESLDVPLLELNLSIAADAFIANSHSPAKLLSGYRPLGYQAHFRNLRNTWVDYWRKLTHEERVACTDLYNQTNQEIDQKHNIKRYRSDRPQSEWGDIDLNDFGKFRLIGQPLVSINSVHSGNNGKPPATGVDIGPLSSISNVKTAARKVGLYQPCPDDTIHFQLIGSLPRCKSLSVQADPPFNLLVTDPLGRRLGFVPGTQAFVNEIGPDASYTGFNTDFTQFIDIGGSLPGRYSVAPVNVTGSAPYDITVALLSEESSIFDSQSTSGNASPGQAISPLIILVPWQPEIDIQPGDSVNSINPTRRGNIPVAILSTAAFDAPAIVNSKSLSFGRTGDEQSGAFCHQEDVDRDGLPDLVCLFNSLGTGFQRGDTLGILKGTTIDGTPIIGRDSVRIVQ